jgi:phosphopantothenoylcysteine decarboxylase / phosphopantothenate---cysteine ligase
MSDAAKPRDARGALAGRTVALCVTGSIAAYKAVELARLLVTAGAKVLPVMTASAGRFLGPLTLAGIAGETVATDMWDASFPGEMHVRLAERADVVAIVPATADVLARLAQGRADDLVTALALCARGPVLAAPAMHPRMWEHPATAANVAALAAQKRVTLVGPVSGEVASGEVGMGRMADPDAIAAVIAALLSPRDLAGVRLVVTAGPTLEDLDPVRFLGNRSTGKMGFAIAQRAAARGAEVTLVTGPVGLPTPHGVTRVDVRGALSMRDALWRATGLDLSRIDALVMAAAVADHRPAEISAGKLKKGQERLTLELVRNPAEPVQGIPGRRGPRSGARTTPGRVGRGGPRADPTRGRAGGRAWRRRVATPRPSVGSPPPLRPPGGSRFGAPHGARRWRPRCRSALPTPGG